MRLRSWLVLSVVLGLSAAACSDNSSSTPDGGSGGSGTGGHAGSDGSVDVAGTGGSLQTDAASDKSDVPQSTDTVSDGAVDTGSEVPVDTGAEVPVDTGAEVPSDGPGADVEVAVTPLKTLNGMPPLVIGHRGLPGLFPEETRPSYENAAAVGADFLEEDLHLSKDCVLVARHNPWLSDNTNITQVATTNADVAARKRTVPGVMVNVTYSLTTYGGPAQYLSDRTDLNDPKSVLKSLVVDGEDHTNDWSITDFTVAELKQWLGGTTYDAAAERPMDMNGKNPILTMQEIIDIAAAKSFAMGRTISVYPEAKNPYWNNAQAIANGCGNGSTHPFEDAIVKLISDNGLNSKTAPIIVQSFDPASLKYMRSIGLLTRAIQLIDGNDVNYATGEMIYQTNDVYNFVDGRPYSWTVGGDGRYFGVMFTAAGLDEIKTYADGIGPWKPQVMTLKVNPLPASDPDGGAYTPSFADVNSAVPNSVIADAHTRGLFVHVYTFRNEKKYLAGVYKTDPTAEYLTFYRAGVDGVFSDFANTAFAARTMYLAETGR